MFTYTVTTDAVTATIIAETPDLAARTFATRERIRGIDDAADLAAWAEEAGGWARVVPGDEVEIEVTHVTRSTTVPLDECPGAVDADITVGDIEGEVTLVVNHEGRLDMWGGIENWASANLHDLPKATLVEIVGAVRAAAARQ